LFVRATDYPLLLFIWHTRRNEPVRIGHLDIYFCHFVFDNLDFVHHVLLNHC
jgi:hypothetical protein